MCNTKLQGNFLKLAILFMTNFKKLSFWLAMYPTWYMVDLTRFPRSSGTSPEPSVRGNSALLCNENSTYSNLGGPSRSRTGDLLIANEAL